jgi:hypothetical protein
MKSIPPFIKRVYNFNKKTLDQLTIDSFISNFPKSEREIVFLMRTTPNFIKKLVSLLLFLLVTFAIVSILIVILILPPTQSIYYSFSKFVAFYPDSYLPRFFFTLVLPEAVFVASLVVLSVLSGKIIKKSKFALLMMLIIFNFISIKIVSKATEFENKPRITSISPSKTSEAWTDVVVTGKNFRDLPFVGKIFLNGIEQGEYLLFWSDERIIFRTSPTLSKSGFVEVQPVDRAPSNKTEFEYNFRL